MSASNPSFQDFEERVIIILVVLVIIQLITNSIDMGAENGIGKQSSNSRFVCFIQIPLGNAWIPPFSPSYELNTNNRN